eukprot:11160552-Lingulodinium_polyedra.AAC.1
MHPDHQRVVAAEPSTGLHHGFARQFGHEAHVCPRLLRIRVCCRTCRSQGCRASARLASLVSSGGI